MDGSVGAVLLRFGVVRCESRRTDIKLLLSRNDTEVGIISEPIAVFLCLFTAFE